MPTVFFARQFGPDHVVRTTYCDICIGALDRDSVSDLPRLMQVSRSRMPTVSIPTIQAYLTYTRLLVGLLCGQFRQHARLPDYPSPLKASDARTERTLIKPTRDEL